MSPPCSGENGAWRPIGDQPRHEDYPALLAEALDVISACGDEPKAAADELGCTPSHLIKFLKETPRALGLVNERRRRAGRHILR